MADEALADKIKTFLSQNTLMVVSSVTPDNLPHAAAVYYIFDEAFNMYFLTKTKTRKLQNLIAKPDVFVVVYEESNDPKTVQIEGKAEVVEDTLERTRLHELFVEKIISNVDHELPLLRLEGGATSIVKVMPTLIQWFEYDSKEEAIQRLEINT